MTGPERPQIQDRGLRRRVGIPITLAGFFFFILGAKPGWFGLDASEAVGFVQIGVFSFGLLLICLGGTVTLDSLWPEGQRTIAADIGVRLAWTGYLVTLFSVTAYMLGLGTRPFPYFQPFFGFWQLRGALAGQLMMIIGFLMMVPYQRFEIKNGKEKNEEI